MSKIKKVILSISIALTMLGALIFGLCLNVNQPLKTSSFSSDDNVCESVDTSTQAKPQHYTYNPNELTIQDGTNQIDYCYVPSQNNLQAKAIAYEYVFGNTMDKTTGIRLKSIDTTGLGVNVSYLYSDKQITTDKEHTTNTKFEM